MDAPPPQEDVRPFVHVAGLIAAAGLHAPRVLEADVGHGFLLLDDLGSELYLQALQAAQASGDAARADALMRDAIAALVAWQRKMPGRRAAAVRRCAAAARARALSRLVRRARVRRHAGARPRARDLGRAPATCSSPRALAQPIVAVHRDWMPRNLMVADPNPGILDFQDAVAGPIAYDVASLLRDAFISWDEEREIDWAVRYWEAAREAEAAGARRLRRVLARRSNGWACSATSRCSASSRASSIATASRRTAPTCRASSPMRTRSRRATLALRPLGRLLEPLMGATPIEAFH